MKKTVKTLIVSVFLMVFMCSTALAGTWMKDGNGYWWQDDQGEHPVSCWQWIDDDGDGIAECYYFDENGYLLMDTTTPDGHTVDENGAWVNGWETQYKALTPDASVRVKEIEGLRLYQMASNRTKQLQNLDATIDLSAMISMDGESIGTKMTQTIKYKDLNTEQMKYLGISEMQLMGQSLKVTDFYEDGYYYMDMYGEKMKTAVDMEDVVYEIVSNLESYNESDYYKIDFELAEGLQGNRMITYKLDTSAFDSLADESITIDYRDMSGRAVVTPDGYCQSDYITIVMDLVSTTEEEEEKLTLAITMDVSYVNPGQPVDFALPSKAEYTLVE